MTITFWCKKCHQGQALKLEMLPETKVQIKEIIEYKSLIKDSSIDYFMPDNELPEIDDEDNPTTRIKNITEEQVMEILSALK